MAAKFITFEGLDGAGKTTHLQTLRLALEARGITVCATREPGGTPLGETLRGLLLDPAQRLGAETETLLMFAARSEHLRTVIQPALAAGTWVLCDRFSDASFAYQSGGSGVAWEKIEVLERWVQDGFQPDLTLYFDIDPDTAKIRMGPTKTPDRFEQERAAFHERVRAAYLRRVREDPARVRLIDAHAGLSDLHVELDKVATSLCYKA